MSSDDRFIEKLYKFGMISFTIIVSLVVSLLMFAIFKSTMASGKVDFCYVEKTTVEISGQSYVLHGFRSWRGDNNLGIYKTPDEVKSAAEKFGCQLGSIK